MPQTDPLRVMLGRILSWEDAHVSFDTAVGRLPRELQGRTPPGLPYSPWQLLEHMRITQHDILSFCVNPDYQELAWPDDYWPATAEPPSASAWDASADAYRADREGLQRLAADAAVDLHAKVPAGTGQTYLRELLLVADHTAYHVGELVAIRRALGAWPPKS